jgi:N-acetylglucosaminyldiphosphoundecaprenol N-acetyl-beta-D-mannosaminyltransferase
VENNVTVGKVQRIRVLDVPIDMVSEDALPAVIGEMASDGKLHHIVFVTLWDLMRARRSREYRMYLERASLVLPVSTGIVRGAAFLKHGRPERYLPYDFVIRTLGILEERRKTVYLFGGSREEILVSEKKLRETFPGLRIVGRSAGRYRKQLEADIVQAIRKASPSLLLAGKGIPGGEKWFRKNRGRLASGILLWGGDCFEVFADKRKRISRAAFRRGLEYMPAFIRRPWRIARLAVYAYYILLLLIYRVGKR